MRLKDDERRFRETVLELGAESEADMHAAAKLAGVHPKQVNKFIRRLAGKPVAIESPPVVVEEEFIESLPSIEVAEADTDLESEDDGSI